MDEERAAPRPEAPETTAKRRKLKKNRATFVVPAWKARQPACVHGLANCLACRNAQRP